MKRLNAFLFAPIAASSLALLRIATGLLTLLWATMLFGDLVPLDTYLRINPDGPILWWQFWPSASPGVVMAMGAGLIVASLLSAVGLWTRWALWAMFGLTLALQRYNPVAFNGGDYILRSVLQLGLALAPAGAYLSVDAWRRDGRLSLEAPQFVPWALRFIQLHISLGYILTVILKLGGDTWPGGTAIWYALNLEDLARFDLPDVLLAPPVGAILTWSTLLIELGVGLGVWFQKTRRWALLGGVLLHVGIAVTFRIGFFPWIMIVSYISFLSPVEDVRRLWPSWPMRILGVGRLARGYVGRPNSSFSSEAGRKSRAGGDALINT